MEKAELEKVCSIDDGGQLTRSRSFKSKQLVRSQAIREATSPPRTASPYSPEHAKVKARTANGSGNASDASGHASDASSRDEDRKKQAVEIQITPGGWEEQSLEQRQRAQLWLGQRHHSDSSRDLLSNNPRVACVCGYCGACPHCRGRRRKPICPKQDSGIVCSDDCPDCSDSEQNVSPKDGPKQTGSLDVDDTFYCRCPERKEKPKNINLSRTDAESEPTGQELVEFIKTTLNKNPRDRATLLKIEKELHTLVNDTGRCIVRFPVMTSYGRMLVHRCASLFQLSHHLDQANKTCVMVSKTGTCGGRIPCTSFQEWCTTNFPRSPQHTRRDDTLAKSILKRSAAAGDEAGAGGAGAVRSKSLEQRERDYERVRRRIFSSDNCTQDDQSSQLPWVTGPIRLLQSEARNKLLKVQSLERSGLEAPRPRGAVSKSHSFGGYAADAPQQRLLSKQGDLASSSWRLSPSSSGYKTLSLRSTDSVTPSPTGGASPEPGVEGSALVWAVTDLNSVPPGALVIHPQTGRPLTNPDGSLYHFDPANPPILQDASVYLQNDTFKSDINNEKRRGRLEKQHSFMDNECECQPTEDCRAKCCCECRRQESCNKNENEKVPIQPEQKPNSIPQSPIKTPTIPTDSAVASNEAKSTNIQSNQAKTIETEVRQYEPTIQKLPYDNNIPPIQKTYENNMPTVQKTAYENNINPIQKTAYEPEKYDLRQPYEQQRHIYETNQREAENDRYESQRQPYEQRQNTYESNQREVDKERYESQRQPYEQQRQNTYEANQKPIYESPQYNGSPSHRTPSLEHQKALEAIRSQDLLAHRLVNRFGQEGQELTQYIAQPYMQGYRGDEVTSPPQAINPAFLPDMANLHNVMLQAKATPVPMQDLNIRGMSLTNVVYPSPMPQGFPYINQCRLDANMQPMFQPMVQPEEQKQLTASPHNNDTTFRIDPSYPYAADFNAACGACTGNCDPTAMQHQHRGYNVSYGPVEVPQYPVSNVILPQQIPHYPVNQQYQEAVPWAVPSVAPPKLLVQELYPVVYPNVYPQYNVVYPPVLQQPYPICQPMYPIERPTETQGTRRVVPQRPSRRNSAAPSARNTPEKPIERAIEGPIENSPESRETGTEIAVKIEQIKEQMAQLNTRERDDRGGRRDEWRRRNSGNGILGNYPANNHINGRVMQRNPNDEPQLSSAARAIVNSIRSMQARNSYHHENRRSYEYAQYYRNDNRHDAYRHRRQDREQDKQVDKPTAPYKRTDFEGKGEADRRFEGGMRNRNFNPVPLQYRPPYLLRQMSPGTWCRRSPGPVHPVLNHPRRPHPDTRNGRR